MTKSVPARPAAKPALLIVDDSVTIRKMIMTALQPLNAIFGEAGSGLEAIEQLTMHPYDAVTLDLNMPDMHGEEFLRFVRSHNGFKQIPILVITTRWNETIRQTILSAGADRYLTKPFTPDEILSEVQALLSR